MTSVLLVLSAADHWTLRDGTEHPSGVWAEEFGISGGLPWKTKRIEAEVTRLQPVLDSPADLYALDPDGYDVIFYSGGHGPMEDLAVDEVSGALLTRRLHQERPVAPLCHAPAASFAARNPDGGWPFEGYRMTGLSNAEERLNPFAWKAKWLLETRLVEQGARYGAGWPLRPRVVVDRNLYTGQNPQTSKALADRLITDFG